MREPGGRCWSSGRAKARSSKFAAARWQCSNCSRKRRPAFFRISRSTRRKIGARRPGSFTTKSEKFAYAPRKKSGGRKKIAGGGRKNSGGLQKISFARNFFSESRDNYCATWSAFIYSSPSRQ